MRPILQQNEGLGALRLVSYMTLVILLTPMQSTRSQTSLALNSILEYLAANLQHKKIYNNLKEEVNGEHKI